MASQVLLARSRSVATSSAPPGTWYVDLLNITLGTRDLATARRRIEQYMDAFGKDGSRITANLDF